MGHGCSPTLARLQVGDDADMGSMWPVAVASSARITIVVGSPRRGPDAICDCSVEVGGVSALTRTKQNLYRRQPVGSSPVESLAYQCCAFFARNIAAGFK